MTSDSEQSSPPIRLSLPTIIVLVGVLFIGASFLPLGKMAARAQWSLDDSAAYDRVSNAYKQSAYESPQRKGLSQAEWDAQREKMRLQMEGLQKKLERAKSQPQRWRRYMLGIGSLLAAAGFYANVSKRS